MKKIEPRIRQKTIPSWKIEDEDLKESHFPDSNLRHKKQAAAVPEPLYRLDQEYDLSLDRIHRIKKIQRESTHTEALWQLIWEIDEGEVIAEAIKTVL